MFDYVVVYDAKLYIKYEKSNYRDIKKVLHSKKTFAFLWAFH